MIHYSRNKNELLVLTGAVYAFVAYLTAFTLEVLFIIDLARQNSEQLMASASPLGTGVLDSAKLALDSAQSHTTISCLAISILYFVLFVGSLILIVAFIVKSTFMLLIWMCLMTTMYLPEFGLIAYVSLHGWGIDTRNGQTELIFYLFRAALNLFFVLRAHRLYKEWSYEKNFFRLKSSSNFTGYDSPYFIGDSLTTTINPVFSSSTLNLNRYDHVRDFHTPQATGDNIYADLGGHNPATRSRPTPARSKQSASVYSRSPLDQLGAAPEIRHASYYGHQRPPPKPPARGHYDVGGRMRDSRSVASLNDNDSFADCELDLDYNTLTNQRHADHQVNRQRSSEIRYSAGEQQNAAPIGHLSYSTQSLDRRHLKDMDFSIPEQVILRPLGHQPFEYLQRPGSTSNLNLSPASQPNAHPSVFQVNHEESRQQRRSKRFVDYNQVDWNNRSRFI